MSLLVLLLYATRQLDNVEFINSRNVNKFALIGDSIQHSLSPKLFKAAYHNYSSLFDYILIETKSIDEALGIIKKREIKAFNVTSPFKEKILDYCHYIDYDAKMAKSANTIIYTDNQFKAYNTDIIGITSTLKEHSLDNLPIIIIGGGGAAKSAAYATRDKETTIVNRSYNKAVEIAKNLNISSLELDQLQYIDLADKVIIYTIDFPINNLDKLDFSKSYIFEANYKSPILNACKCKKYIKGEHWLINQAIPAFKLFTGIEPNLEAINKVINRY